MNSADDGLAGEFVVQLRGFVFVEFGQWLTNRLQRSKRGMDITVLDLFRRELLLHEEAQRLLRRGREPGDALVFSRPDAPRKAIEGMRNQVNALARRCGEWL